MLHDSLIYHAKNHPNNIAVKDSLISYTYSELNALSSQVANALLFLGAHEQEIIPLYTNRTSTAIAAIFGILKTKSIYLPLDKQSPYNYISKIISECNCKFIITDSESLVHKLNSGFPNKYTFIFISSHSFTKDKNLISLNELLNYPVEYNCTCDNKDIPAYIYFTSGSTGFPKGIIHTHNSAIAFVNWSKSYFGVEQRDKIAGLSKWNFDLSTFEIFTTISAGATLILFSDGIVNFNEASIQNIVKNEITIIYGVPTFFSKWTVARNRLHLSQGHLRLILFAGEIFPRDVLHSLFNELPGVNFYNLYGPTETNVCTVHHVTHFDFYATEYHFIPIGKPCSYSTILLVNENLEIISSLFTKAEILVSGSSLMQGYFSQSNSDLFISLNNEIYYRTGDFAFLNQNSDLVFIGRNDRLIKRGGFRVELSEIEYITNGYVGVKEVAAIFFRDKIHIFLDLHNTSSTVQVNDIAEFCRLNLAGYMIPDYFHISTIPKTLNGKINYTELRNRIEFGE